LHGLSTYVVFCFCTHVSINAGVGQAAQQPLGLLPVFVNHSFNVGFLFFFILIWASVTNACRQAVGGSTADPAMIDAAITVSEPSTVPRF
jgi:hypothetical protein